jgi:uncharacterized coiled-coil protein SlyX
MPTPCDIHKRRDIQFHGLPPGQADRAIALLQGLPGLRLTRTSETSIEIRYCVQEYSLEAIEGALTAQDFHLATPLWVQLRRALVYYMERVQRGNLQTPEVHTKNYQAHVESWDKHPHGDHDETPSEWRQYK